MQVLYRISNNSYAKARLPVATKEYCLENIITNVITNQDNMLIIADCVEPHLLNFIKSKKTKNIELLEQNFGSNGASFRFQLELASTFPDEQTVLLQEDDYLYLPSDWPYQTKTSYSQLFDEALKYADYVSAYDHPDKYLPPSMGGNSYISTDGIENTGIFKTKHSHWKFTNSTTCTFASKAKTVRKDLKIWKQFCKGDHPYDFQAFIALSIKGRKLATSIPGKATHSEENCLSPFFQENCL